MPPDADGAADETVTFQFEMSRADWNRWKETVPRDLPLHERIVTLIEQDRRAAETARTDSETQSMELLASRIRIRATQADGAIRGDEGDTDAAREQIQEIVDLADAIES